MIIINLEYLFHRNIKEGGKLYYRSILQPFILSKIKIMNNEHRRIEFKFLV